MTIALSAACGGGGGGGGGKSAFVAKANELCRTLADDYAKGVAALGPAPTKPQVAEFLRASFIAEALGTYRSVVDLGFPSADREALDTLFTQTQAELFLIQADPAVGGNASNQRSLTARFKAYGLDQCGGGFARAVDKAQFLTEANGVCRALNESYHKAYRDADVKLSSPPDQLKVLLHTRIVPLTRQALTDIEAIGFPPGDEQTLTAIVADTRTLLDRIDADPNRATYGDTAEELAINKRWIDFGAVDCGGQVAAVAAPSS
jgi:hypothetical protein